MLDITIPGFGRLELTNAVCDYNGTLAADGTLLHGVRARIELLGKLMRVHVVTADTFGSAAAQLQGLPCAVTIIGTEAQAESKRAFVQELGSAHVVAIGNGRNDRMMLDEAALGIAVCGAEGLAVEAMQASEVVVRDVADALDLLLRPKRLVATLRA
jgi:soluble P-type ATPase